MCSPLTQNALNFVEAFISSSSPPYAWHRMSAHGPTNVDLACRISADGGHCRRSTPARLRRSRACPARRRQSDRDRQPEMRDDLGHRLCRSGGPAEGIGLEHRLAARRSAGQLYAHHELGGRDYRRRSSIASPDSILRPGSTARAGKAEHRSSSTRTRYSPSTESMAGTSTARQASPSPRRPKMPSAGNWTFG